MVDACIKPGVAALLPHMKLTPVGIFARLVFATPFTAVAILLVDRLAGYVG